MLNYQESIDRIINILLSPAGSLKSGRHNTQFHAVLPLRGKILSVLDKTVDQALDNKEIHTIFKVIGLGMDVNNVTKDAKSFEEAYELIKKYSRYGKIVIAVDADPDGEQIKKLILYLFGKIIIIPPYNLFLYAVQ